MVSSTLSPGGYVRQGQRGVSPPRSVNVQVAVRCRPLNSREIASGERSVLLCTEDRREVVCVAPATQRKGPAAGANSKKTYTYDHVFGPDATQADVFEGIVKPIVDEVLQGYNCTVFAYGQTGTGKTHTMEGRRDEDMVGIQETRLAENAGIIPRAVKQVFDHLRSITDEHSVRVSHLELYNEQLTDLLSPHDACADTLRMYEDPAKGTFVQGLEDIVVTNEEEIFAVLDKSALKRRTAETLMNKYSSRSHSVFSITIHIKESTPEGADLLKVGKLNLVDLAGSENVGRSGAIKGRAREAGNINQSLLTLGRVITALVDRHPHIPYRDSKLTRLLQESLGGRNKTCIIATVTPGSHSLEETASTLDYAYRAKSIKNRPTVNQMIAKHVLLKEYTEEIFKLKKELDATRSKNGVYLPPEEYQRLQAIANDQKVTISQLETRNEDFEKRAAALIEKLENTEEILRREQRELAVTKETLHGVRQSLKETEDTLATVTQQRDENAYIIQHHVATEATLHEQGDHLQSTLDICASRNHVLHKRIDAKASLEKENVDSLSRLQNSVGRSVAAFCESAQAHERDQVTQLKCSQTSVAKLVTDVDAGLLSIATTLKEYSEKSLNLEAEHAEANAALLDDNQKESRQGLDTLLEKIADCKSAVLGSKTEVVKMASAISESIKKTRAVVADVKEQVVTQNLALEKRHKDFTKELTGACVKLRSDVADHARRQSKISTQLKHSTEHQFQRQKILLEETQAKVINEVTAALRLLAVESAVCIDNARNSTNEELEKLLEASSELEDNIGEVSVTLEKNLDDCVQKSAAQSNDLLEHLKHKEANVTDLKSSAETSLSTIHSSLNCLSQSMEDWHTDVSEHLNNAHLAQVRFQEESTHVQSSQSDVRKETLASHLASVETASASVQSATNVTAGEIQAQLKTYQDDISKFATFTNERLSSTIDQPLQSHSIVRDSEPAPEADEWPARAQLVRTRDHESLISELRRRNNWASNSVEDVGVQSKESDGDERESECEDMGMRSSASEASMDSMAQGLETVALADVTNRKTRSRLLQVEESQMAKKPSGIPLPRTRSRRRIGV